MKIYLHNKDILDITEADTIVLPVDGSAPGLYGNITQRIMQAVGVKDMHELYAPPPYYPFSHHWSRFERFGFDWLCALGVLSHAPDADHKAQLRQAFYAMLEGTNLAGDLGRKIATTVLAGGHRMRPVDALMSMLSVAQQFPSPLLVLHIVEKDPVKYAMMQPLVA